MSTLAISNRLTDWDAVVSGDGTYVEASGALSATVTAGGGSGRSYVRKDLPVTQGDVITFTFLARRISGSPQASIDYPAIGSSKAVVLIDSDEWMEYSFSYVVPHTHDEATDYAACTLGVFTTPAGSAEISNPRIDVEGGTRGVARTYCMGLIALSKSGGVTTPSVNQNFHNTGIVSLAMVANYLEVTALPTVNASGLELRPIFQVGLTPDAAVNITPKVGQYNAATGVVQVFFVNENGNLVNINDVLSDGQIAYLSITAAGI